MGSGAVIARPVYAPALVAFVGGSHFSIGMSIGGGMGAVGWFPLAPREAYYPAYHVSNTYIRQVNITHVTNINVTNVNVTNVHYANQQVAGAVTAVPQNAFVNARPVAAAAQRVTPQQMAGAQVLGAAPHVAPQRQSVLGSAVNRQVAAPPQAVMSRQVVARATPPPAAIAFQAKQQLLEQNQGRPLAPQQMTELRQQRPAAVMNRAGFRPASAPSPAIQGRPLNANPGVPVPQPSPQQVRPEISRPQVANPQTINPQNQPQPGRAIPPMNRMDSRPPSARPVPQASPETTPNQSPARPEFRRPAQQSVPNAPVQPARPELSRPAPESHVAPESRPAPHSAPESRPNPEGRSYSRPAPESRPTPRNHAVEPAPSRTEPHRSNQPARSEKHEDKREEKR